MAKTVEVDEATWNQMQSVVRLAEQIHANPEGRKLLELAHRTIDPKAKAPTIEQEQRFSQPLNDIQKQIADLTATVTKRFEDEETGKKLDAIRRQQDEGFQRLIDEQGYRPEGIEQIKKIMSDKGILEPEIAAAYFEKTNPPQTPITPTGSNSVNFIEAFNDQSESNKAYNELLNSRGESESALNRLVQESLQDVRKIAPTRR